MEVKMKPSCRREKRIWPAMFKWHTAQIWAHCTVKWRVMILNWGFKCFFVSMKQKYVKGTCCNCYVGKSTLHCTENWDETLSTRGIWICKYTFINPVEISLGNFESPHSYWWFLFIHFARPEVWYLVIARNEWDKVELVDEYVGMAVQKLCKGNRKSRDLTP